MAGHARIRMEQQFRIEGMHCDGCVSRVARALKAVDSSARVTLDPPQASFDAPSPVALEKVRDAL
ncbi:MAG TPA: heavy metal-associated domain-containing protein, partial [Burkholderiaceae bacterium]